MTVETVVAFFTSKTGIAAAVATLLALVVSVLQILRPALERRRTRHEVRADLRIANMRIALPPAWSDAARMQFELLNVGKGQAILSDLLLEVLEHGTIELPKMVIEAAPVPQYTYRVTLRPDVKVYDVRKKEFATPPPHAYGENEAESVVIEVRSTEHRWYRVQLVLRWYDAKHPTAMVELRSEPQRLEFEPHIEDLIK